MEYYTYSQAPRLTKYLHLKTLDKKGVFVFYSHTPLMAKVHKSVGNGRGEIKADSISPRLYNVKLRPICPKNNTKSSTSPSVLQY